MTITGVGGAGTNTSLTFDVDGAAAAVPTIIGGVSDLVAVDDGLSVGVNGTVAEGITNAGFAIAGGNDIYVAGMAGVVGNVYTNAAFVAGSTTTYADGTLTDTDANADDLYDVILAAGADALRVSVGNLRVGNGAATAAAMDG